MPVDPNDDSSSSDDEGTQKKVVYTCRKCIGVELTRDELEGHRDKHRREREEKKARDRRMRKRGGSPAPSTMTTATSDLFITQTHKTAKPLRARPGPKSKKSAAEKARLKSAKEKHRKGAEVTMGERNNGG